MNIWDKIYKKKLHASIWPWNEVIKSTNLFIKKKKLQGVRTRLWHGS